MTDGLGTDRMRVARLVVRSTAWHFYLCLASAVLMYAMFPPLGWGWLAHVAIVPLVILAVRSVSHRMLIASSFLVFFTWWLLKSRWLTPVTVGGYIGMCALMAVYVPVTLLMIRWLHRKYGLPLTLVAPLAWTTVEFVREHLFAGGFNWFMLSHSQAAFTERAGLFGGLSQLTAGRFVQVADLFGERTITFILCMTNGAVVDLLIKPWTRRGSAGRRVPNRSLRLALLLWAAVVLSAWGYGQWRLGQTDALTGPKVGILTVQTNVPQDNKNSRDFGQQQEDLDAFRKLVRDAAAAVHQTGQPLDLVATPETTVVFGMNVDALRYHERVAKALAEDALQADMEVRSMPRPAQGLIEQIEATLRLADMNLWVAEFPRALAADVAEHVRAPLFIGARSEYDFKVVQVSEDEQYVAPHRIHNSVYLFDTDGTLRQERYHKMHLVPFGEYMPWIGAWPWLKMQFIGLLTPYAHDYTVHPGKRPDLFELTLSRGGGAEVIHVATPICYEAAVPRHCRRMVWQGGGKKADVFLNMTNDGWYVNTSQQPQHLQIAVLRTIETRTPMVRSVNTGISCFIDSAGRVGPQVERDGRRVDVAGWAYHQLPLDDRVTLFLRLGEWPMILLVLGTVALVLGGVLRKDAERL